MVRVHAAETVAAAEAVPCIDKFLSDNSDVKTRNCSEVRSTDL